MAAAGDLYRTLQVCRAASDADIKQAYRRLALHSHPARSPGAAAQDTFLRLGEAYEVLSDPRKRAAYDRFGEEGLRAGLPLEVDAGGAWTSKFVYHGKPDKTFRRVFGGDNPFAEFYTQDEAPPRGLLGPPAAELQDPPIQRDLHVSLEDLYHGCTKKIKISRRVLNEDGRSSSIREKILSVDVRPGWQDGTRVVFSKEGDQGLNSVPADMVFIVRQKTHPQFERRDSELVYTAQVSLLMALTGFSLSVETLDGRILRIPVNDIVHPSYRKVVSGEGMPLVQDPSRRGDLVIAFDVRFPEKLSAERKRLVERALLFKP